MDVNYYYDGKIVPKCENVSASLPEGDANGSKIILPLLMQMFVDVYGLILFANSSEKRWVKYKNY